ncbi:MAG: ABC-type transporter, integral membrane subunit [Candidatus Magasanikbacteria bacterium GW2011_GWC2_40_17]|uniref:ABC-type transporter, integral membrane subunit n=1 Tax=Candidatus Magasanikbacteria bacterium GW2011_GWA2_42_32 TaxID=1619039 RepID=A0A0G1A841_9BACT|nr:MAG: ABC-type transporter, integral membrane subunit [Candidatus Magasanikbacteria bacterium GW2011_GWC2_40_17]KKS57089.1 MAG: ABC-type transporter, integral membrane subunit [Candidatus Magasanikbacteria bacterium GW2011_GWA2_42_32]OGH85387.1 MAG: hypothetical protein A2294_01320 [Candidatus Magasanikbacteria bacterium RIFOXYB2_FULL_38_10]
MASYDLREELPQRNALLVELIGFSAIIGLWTLITEMEWIPVGILPSPLKVGRAIIEMNSQDALIANAVQSLKVNVLGLLEAVILGLPLGLAIGLNKYLRALCKRFIVVIRFLPLTILIGLFIAWFKLGDFMKIQFLATSIFLYLLPAVLQRVREVEDVYVQTVTTLGATKWQSVWYVFLPAVVSRSFDDIINLGAISWTYIVAAEMSDMYGGGLGALSYLAARQSRVDKLFGLVIIIILIGFLLDKVQLYLDKTLFAYKYANKEHGR